MHTASVSANTSLTSATHTRADRWLVDQGWVASRARAQELIRRGAVRCTGVVVVRPSELLAANAEVTIDEPLRFVSRGGDKLDAALSAFALDVEGRRALDVGASTGGFTDCLLQRGASTVCALDVGHEQLDARLRADARVVVREGVNARDLVPEMLPFVPDLVVVDASFISLAKLAAALGRITPQGADLVALVKPQFEVGAASARRTKGVVRNSDERSRSIRSAVASLVVAGFRVIAETDSAVTGPKGNVERFVHAVREG